MNENRVCASFRDPAGYVFEKDSQIFRRIMPAGVSDYERFIRSGLAEQLLRDKSLVPFKEISRKEGNITLELEKMPFISYPYEWSFSQLRDAALLTLRIMRQALEHGMVLKDASAFNIAFQNGRPIFLDHTSFTAYRENEPWRAYRQFAMHFLAPLLLMKKVDLRSLAYFRTDLGGIPLDLASRLLPVSSWLNPGILIHIHLHGKLDQYYSSDGKAHRNPVMSKKQLENMILSLEDFTSGLRISGQKTQWADYYEKNSYEAASLKFKNLQVENFCREIAPKTTLDLGANTGFFSETAALYSKSVIAADIDPQAVEQLYRLNRDKIPHLQPVLLDLNNPTPDTGVFNEERQSFLSRCRSDLVLGLALIHHLRITGNWTIEQIVRLFAQTGQHALVEFVPLDDIQVRRLIRGRETLFDDWTLDAVTNGFRKEFRRMETVTIPGCTRTMIKLHKN